MATPLPTQINILTLNCWGLKFNISKLRKERLQEIGRQLSQTIPAPQIVCLQEVWSHDDYLAIRRSLRALLPHGKFYHSGAFGAGLAILSHWPIDSATMTPYALNGRPTAFWRGDWYVGKGIAHAAIRLPSSDDDDDNDNIIDVFNTHTHPAYRSSSSSAASSPEEDTYRVHRLAQAWQLAKLLRIAAASGHLVIAAGDFNMDPLGPEHRLLTAHAPGLRDLWRVLHPQSSLGAATDSSSRKAVPTAAHNLSVNGATSNNVLNTWRWPPSQRARLGPGKPLHEPAPETPDPHGKRLDYIFATTGAREMRLPSRASTTTSDDDTATAAAFVGGWVVRDARVGMVQRHPELGCSLSDHFSVEATLVFHTTPLTSNPAASRATTREGDGTTTGVPSISGWPLPPGRLSMHNNNNNNNNNMNMRRSTPPQLQQQRFSAFAVDNAAAAAAAVNGTFLSLGHSPNTSRNSLSHTHSHHTQHRLPSLDFDTQLLTSIPPFTTALNNNNAFTPSDYTHLLTAITLYAAREADQVRLRLAHFAFWLFALVACCIATWFIPIPTTTTTTTTHTHDTTMPPPPARLGETAVHGVYFVMLLLSSLGLVVGVVDGLMALLFFGGSEKRALKEFEWEVRNAKRIVLGEDAPPPVEGVEVGKYD